MPRSRASRDHVRRAAGPAAAAPFCERRRRRGSAAALCSPPALARDTRLPLVLVGEGIEVHLLEHRASSGGRLEAEREEELPAVGAASTVLMVKGTPAGERCPAAKRSAARGQHERAGTRGNDAACRRRQARRARGHIAWACQGVASAGTSLVADEGSPSTRGASRFIARGSTMAARRGQDAARRRAQTPQWRGHHPGLD